MTRTVLRFAAVALPPLALYMACGSRQEPSSPTSGAGLPQGDRAVAYATPSPIQVSPVPAQPSPSGIRPSASPINPSPSPVRPSPSPVTPSPSPAPFPSASPVNASPSPTGPSPSPVNTSPSPVDASPSPVVASPSPVQTEPSPINPTPTPEPTPTPTPTPAPTPTPTPSPTCPGTLQVAAADVPKLLAGSGTASSIAVSNLTSTCKVGTVRVAFRVTSANLALNSVVGAELARTGGPTILLFSTALTGTELGSTCPSDLAFQSGAANSFPPASPPYTGTFAPSQPTTTFNGVLANGTWRLDLTFDGGSAAKMMVECFSLSFTLTP